MRAKQREGLIRARLLGAAKVIMTMMIQMMIITINDHDYDHDDDYIVGHSIDIWSCAGLAGGENSHLFGFPH